VGSEAKEPWNLIERPVIDHIWKGKTQKTSQKGGTLMDEHALYKGGRGIKNPTTTCRGTQSPINGIVHITLDRI